MRWDFRKIYRGYGSTRSMYFLYHYVAFMLFSPRNLHHHDCILLRGENTPTQFSMTLHMLTKMKL